ncbi:3'-5' exonuclease family protein [Streptomyces daliensis]|uniref:3'-5' exonuclease n=1 Tax=Streptomyces daliensis TaxID=299421 RepID=A0A8T4J4X8_9ACTN|nr:3'-5' exonuclease [Streptomyces daliensis]
MTFWYEGPLTAFAALPGPSGGRAGGDAERDRIASTALVGQPWAGAPVAVRHWVVETGVPGHDTGPVVEELARAMAWHEASGTPLVVMNAPYGLTLLDRELRRHRGASLAVYLHRSSLCVLDPLVLHRHLDRAHRDRRSLDALCAVYGTATSSVATNDAVVSDAVMEALTALDVLRAVGRRYATRLAPLRPAELHTLQAVWHATQARGLSAWFAREGTDHPVDPAWPLRAHCLSAL